MGSYRQAWEQIVCPPRRRYPEEILSQPQEVGDVSIKQQHFLVPVGQSGQKLSVTVFHAADRPLRSLCIYLHTFSGNKLEGRFLLDLMLPDVGVALYDASGCGNAEGYYVTLGLREREDLEVVVMTLHQQLSFEELLLYGRSMGAATILHFLSDAEERLQRLDGLKLCGVVIDAAFTDAYTMIRDILVSRGFSSFLAALMLVPARISILVATGYDVLGANHPARSVSRLTTPACFLLGEQDELVNGTDFCTMVQNYGSCIKKLVVMPDIDHADERPEEALNAAAAFLKAQVRAKAPKESPDSAFPCFSDSDVKKAMESSVIEGKLS